MNTDRQRRFDSHLKRIRSEDEFIASDLIQQQNRRLYSRNGSLVRLAEQIADYIRQHGPSTNRQLRTHFDCNAQKIIGAIRLRKHWFKSPGRYLNGSRGEPGRYELTISEAG